MNRQLAILTGLYVGVVGTAQVSANKIVELPFTHLADPAGTYLIGLALALIETAHHTAPTAARGLEERPDHDRDGVRRVRPSSPCGSRS